MSIKVNAYENDVLNVMRGVSLTAWTPYAGLIVTNTDPEAPTVTECTGTGYARVAVTFGAPSPAGTIANSAEVDYGTAGAGDWNTIVAVGLWSAASGGSPRYVIPLTVSKTPASGDPVKFPVGSLVVSEA